MTSQAVYNVGIYARISKDDERVGESVSIENQKAILTKHISKQSDWMLYKVYVDDGWSGSNFQRPAFQMMLEDAKNGTINLVLVKDLSRLGRNYIEVGQLTDNIFPVIGCRFVALNDNVDTINNNNDFMPFLNLLNEMHSRDTSKKVRMVKKARAENGKFIGKYAPYGYKKDSSNNHQLVIDETNAVIVRRVFEMRKNGMGYYSIANMLNNDNVPSPRKTWYSKAEQDTSKAGAGLWSDSCIMRMLRNEVYLGHMVQGKQGTISFRNRKVTTKPETEWIRVKHTHEPIIEQELWDRVQELNRKKHKPRKLVNGTSNIFLGLLKCADCDSLMRYQGRKYSYKDGSTRISKAFLCGGYSRNGKNACSAHSIKEEALSKLVFSNIKDTTTLMLANEPLMIENLLTHKNEGIADALFSYRRELNRLHMHIGELDNLIQRLYEDRAESLIPLSVFDMLMKRYSVERDEKCGAANILEQKINASTCSRDDVITWINILKKYSVMEKLSHSMLLDLIDHIDIGISDVKGGNNVKIFYRHVGNIDIDRLKTDAE